MPDTPVPTADPVDVPARQPLPGTRIIAYRIPACGMQGPYLHMDTADIHARYTQKAGRAGNVPARTFGFGPHTPGWQVDNFLRSSLNF